MGWWYSDSLQFLYYELPANKTKTGLGQNPITKAEGYLNIFVKSFRILHAREGWTKFAAGVHSFISVPKRENGRFEVHTFTSPNELQQLDPGNADHIINQNIRLFGPFPYYGGDLDLKVGLFSIKAADYSGPFLDMVSGVAKAAGYSHYVTAAMPFIDTLKQGIQTLTDTGKDARLDVGLNKTFDQPFTGYFAIIGASQGQLDTSTLRVDNSWRLVDDTSGVPVPFDNLVFTIELTSERADWADIPDLKTAYDDLRALLQADDVTNDKIQAEFARFRKKVKASPDLIPADTDKVLNAVRDFVEGVSHYRPTSVMPLDLVNGQVLPEFKDLDIYGHMIRIRAASTA